MRISDQKCIKTFLYKGILGRNKNPLSRYQEMTSVVLMNCSQNGSSYMGSPELSPQIVKPWWCPTRMLGKGGQDVTDTKGFSKTHGLPIIDLQKSLKASK